MVVRLWTAALSRRFFYSSTQQLGVQNRKNQSGVKPPQSLLSRFTGKERGRRGSQLQPVFSAGLRGFAVGRDRLPGLHPLFFGLFSAKTPTAALFPGKIVDNRRRES